MKIEWTEDNVLRLAQTETLRINTNAPMRRVLECKLRVVGTTSLWYGVCWCMETLTDDARETLLEIARIKITQAKEQAR